MYNSFASTFSPPRGRHAPNYLVAMTELRIYKPLAAGDSRLRSWRYGSISFCNLIPEGDTLLAIKFGLPGKLLRKIIIFGAGANRF